MSKGVTASSLARRVNRTQIHGVVIDQVKAIDHAILTSHAAGFDQATCELPTNFSIGSMSKEEAQMMIYSELITLYKAPEPAGKGFDKVSIDPGEKTYFYVGWNSGIEADERTNRTQIIADSLVNHRRSNKR